jgi:diketogulonate reductase-like aldo/keto reductase
VPDSLGALDAATDVAATCDTAAVCARVDEDEIDEMLMARDSACRDAVSMERNNRATLRRDAPLGAPIATQVGTMERRDFLKTSLAAACASGVGMSATAAPAPARPNAAATALDPHDLLRVSDPGERRGDMLYRTLGRTGEKVSLIGLGGSHLSRKPLEEQDAIKLVHAALDRGITFLDNCWDYGGGNSERWMGAALAQGGYRHKAFLMTKLDGRTKEAATSQLDESLRRLQTDRIDLVQFHEILRFDDPDRIFTDGGAIEALVAAKQAGKLRFIGFTGHKDPRVHLYMLEVAARHGFHFDTVQMPLNVLDAHFRSFSHDVVPEAVKQGIGVLAMKTMADGAILKSGAPVTAIECLHYAMNLPTSVVITGIDSARILDQAFEATRTFKPMSAEEVAVLVAKTASFAEDGKYEFFKTSSHFDGTAKHPDWLGGESPLVQKLGASVGS